MRDNLILTKENALAFERSINFLQQTLMEFRQISLGMMPELLYKNGLDEALRQKCAEISAARSVSIQYQSVGLDEGGLSRDRSVAVYRIIQEFLDNVESHASPQNVFIQVRYIDGKLHLHVHDDGVGMHGKDPIRFWGGGLQNMQHRVESLKGNMHVDSVSGKGTTVTIALHL
jgi:two-component system, NarL family, sensor kinase